jgi:hypothetical protein
VERELSAHIDDRVSYYVDAGWDEETANEKAMEHMGNAEDIAEKMSKVHNKVNRFVMLVISMSIFGLYFILELPFWVFRMTDLSIVFEGDEWYTVLIRDYFLIIVLLVLTGIAYSKRGIISKITMLIDFSIVFLNVLNIILILYYLFRDFDGLADLPFIHGIDFVANIVSVILMSIVLVCTYFSCRGEGEKSIISKKIVIIVVCVIVVVIAVIVYLFVGLGPTELLIYENEMPKEYAVIPDEYKDLDTSFFSSYLTCGARVDVLGDRFGNFGVWHAVDGYFKPTAKVSKPLSDGGDWILNDDWNYLYSAYGTGAKGVAGSICINENVLLSHDFLTAELSGVKIGDTEVINVFTEEEIDFIRQTIEKYNIDYINGDQNSFDFDFDKLTDENADVDELAGEMQEALEGITDGADERFKGIKRRTIKKYRSVYWFYKGLDGIYLEKGIVIQTKDGNVYLTMDAWEQDNELVSDGGFSELDGEIKEKMQNVMETAKEMPEEPDEYELAKMMQESVRE